MSFVIVAIIIVIAGFTAASVIKDVEYRGQVESRATARRLIRIASAALAIVIVALACVSYVPTGYTGIVTTFGKVHDTTLDAGIAFHSPFDNVIKMDNREQKIPFELLAFSADIQEVSVNGSINLNIDKSTAMILYREVGQDYLNILAMPRILEDVKTVFSQYSAENLIAKRSTLSTAIAELLRADLGSQGLNIISVAIENIDFSDAYTNSVEAKQVATQEKQRAQTEQEQKTMEAEQAAARKKIEAEAAAEVQRIAAEAEAYAIKVKAEAEAAANKEVSSTLTDELIQYTMVNIWNGKLPTVSLGDNGTPVINLGGFVDADK